MISKNKIIIQSPLKYKESTIKENDLKSLFSGPEFLRNMMTSADIYIYQSNTFSKR